ncbi:MAG: hypothetical protein CVV41_16320 [Candidatus Riflebacteria bacterium HGW-Riflebacteria-1]|jgi:uncharacterized protein YigE (DUF2233 family)|nr:MAG: hypothetical protein CVV41_16320 [Candidatus Riflebacteria bacterium HGW-Riflebacteria-1]
MNKIIGLAETFKVGKLAVYSSQSLVIAVVAASFLISVEKADEAEKYLLERADQLSGRYYNSLPDLAKTMESQGRNLVVSIIYRQLLVGILLMITKISKAESVRSMASGQNTMNSERWFWLKYPRGATILLTVTTGWKRPGVLGSTGCRHTN